MVQLRSFDGGELPAYIALPAAGRGPGIVVLHEIFGVNENMRAICDGYAALGFVAICPDLYWRIEPGIDLSPERDMDRARSLLAKLDLAKAVEDAAAAVDFLRKHPACTGRTGSVGYCLGGRLAYMLTVSHRLDAAVGYYGVGIEQSLGDVKCPLMLH